MALSAIERAGIILDLIKDGVVADEANYTPAKVDRIASGVGLAIFQDFWRARQAGSPPNAAAGAQNFLARLKEFILSNAETAEAPSAAKAAELAARAAAKARINSDLGT